jgi:hypothetical protein
LKARRADLVRGALVSCPGHGECREQEAIQRRIDVARDGLFDDVDAAAGVIGQVLGNKRRAQRLAGAMVAGWKFLGEFKRGRRESLSLECIVALRDRNEAEEIARKKLVGADKITAVELSRAQLTALNIIQGDVRL